MRSPDAPPWLKELTDLMQINNIALLHIVMVITGAITAHCQHRLTSVRLFIKTKRNRRNSSEHRLSGVSVTVLPLMSSGWRRARGRSHRGGGTCCVTRVIAVPAGMCNKCVITDALQTAAFWINDAENPAHDFFIRSVNISDSDFRSPGSFGVCWACFCPRLAPP